MNARKSRKPTRKAERYTERELTRLVNERARSRGSRATRALRFDLPRLPVALPDRSADALEALRHESPTARALLQHLAQATYCTRETTVDAFRRALREKNVPAERRDIIRVLRRFDDLQLGHFHPNARTRIEWWVDPRVVGRVGTRRCSPTVVNPANQLPALCFGVGGGP